LKLIPIFAIFLAILVSGCATVPKAATTESLAAKAFNPPSPGQAGLYVYRDSNLGAALKKDIWVDGKCLGESAAGVFFYTEVEGDKNHTISTESEFSPNNIELMVESGKNYFVRQVIKWGVFVGGANLEVVPELKGRNDVMKLDMAAPGSCSSTKT
jgi:hypothetical protein